MLLMDIAGAPIRAEQNELKVGENFIEKKEVVVLWCQIVARLCFRKRQSVGVDNDGQINRNSTNKNFWNIRTKTFWFFSSPHCWLVYNLLLLWQRNSIQKNNIIDLSIDVLFNPISVGVAEKRGIWIQLSLSWWPAGHSQVTPTKTWAKMVLALARVKGYSTVPT